jgi:EAL domain-containing protein (putative c-di-GMP-specific phosphodiesterase class I)
VAVNVSVMQFVESDFLQGVARELMSSGLQPHLLELEITESVLQSLENSKRILKDLKRIGVSVAIDDFGTGYSSMAVLKDLAVDRLKIDRSFICNTHKRGCRRMQGHHHAGTQPDAGHYRRRGGGKRAGGISA